MNGWQVGRLVSDTAETVIAFAANAAKSVQYRKVLLCGAFAALLAVAAVPILVQADMPSVGANNTLKCYDRAGNDQPCPARGSASLSRSDGPTAGIYRPASWAATALYLQESPAIAAADQPAPATTAANQPAAAADQSASGKTNAPATKHSAPPQRRIASAVCGRHLLPCVFSAFRRGITHLASVAATEAGVSPSRRIKERSRPKDL